MKKCDKDLRKGGVLVDWYLTQDCDGNLHVKGFLIDDSRWVDGTAVVTSKVGSISGYVLRTSNTRYNLANMDSTQNNKDIWEDCFFNGRIRPKQ